MRRSAILAPLWLCAAFIWLAPLGGCATSTYGTGQVPEMALFREMTGGILSKTEKKEPIEYQPRAPLVMPPAAGEQLPQPMETAAAASPDWPMDPTERLGPVPEDDGDPRNDINPAEYRRLRPLAGVFANAERPRQEFDETGKTEYYKIVHGRKQREEFKTALAESKGFTRADRRFLTDPPTTYREPVATATGEVVPQKKKKGNFLTRWWTGG